MDISILILSYNTRDITVQTLRSLGKALEVESVQSKVQSYQVIVVDNASTDGSGAVLRDFTFSSSGPGPRIEYVFVQNETNVGYSRGNNIALARATGRYILYLNSDMIVDDLRLDELISYMEAHREVGALTVRVDLTSGRIDPASHRGFPTPWRSLMYYAGMEKIISNFNPPAGGHISNKRLPHPSLRGATTAHLERRGNLVGTRDSAYTHEIATSSQIRRLLAMTDLRKASTLFGGYHLLDKDLQTVHEIDSCTGAFLLTSKSLIDEIGGFDEQFFMYGEDLDLCFQIKQKGYQVIWYPLQSVTHLKSQSGLGSTTAKTRKKIRWHFYDAMERFYIKHYKSRYLQVVSWMVLWTIGRIKKRYT